MKGASEDEDADTLQFRVGVQFSSNGALPSWKSNTEGDSIQLMHQNKMQISLNAQIILSQVRCVTGEELNAGIHLNLTFLIVVDYVLKIRDIAR